MKTIKVAKIPKCDFCSEPAIYDAPTRFGSSWAYMCLECTKENGFNVHIGRRLEQLKEVEVKGGPAKVARTITDPELILMDEEDRDVECPDCGDTRTVEPDAAYEFNCGGCGIRLVCDTPLC